MKKNDKVELICYYPDDFCYTYDKYLDRYYLSNALRFIPYKMSFNEKEINELLDILLCKEGRIKVILEREDKER